MEFVFVSGNLDKVHYLEKFLGQKVEHRKLDLDEIQSVNPNEVLLHKAKEAFSKLKRPILIEDTSVSFDVLGKLPGPLIKFFLEEIGNEGLCKMMDGYSDRSARVNISYGLYDGNKFCSFTGEKIGKISKNPKGSNGYGWDPIFIPEGSDKTYAEMNEEEYTKHSARNNAVQKLKKFLKKNTKA